MIAIDCLLVRMKVLALVAEVGMRVLLIAKNSVNPFFDLLKDRLHVVDL